MSNTTNSGSKQKRISTQLLLCLVPMIAIFIIVVSIVIFVNSRSVIVDQGKYGLDQETTANAKDIAKTIDNLKGYYNGLADTVQMSDYESGDALIAALAKGMNAHSDMVSDVYAAFSDRSFYDGAGWIPPEDYDPTTRGWYKTGESTNAVVLGAPSFDLTTGAMVVCGSRSLKLRDGRGGVLSIDIVLDRISKAVQEYTPSGTGHSMLLSGTTIIGSSTPGYVGTEVSDHTDDTFLQAVYNSSRSASEVETIDDNDGSDNFVAFSNVPGTDWVLVSYVPVNDVLSSLQSLQSITIILVIVMLAISSIIIVFLIRKMITAPVTDLTETITKIADGDFTVDIKRGGNNEIGTMNNRMHDYVTRMRETLGEMQNVTRALSEEASASRSAAEVMSDQADQQSISMDQIHTAMEGLANSVTDLADNATELAQAVDATAKQGTETKEIMEELLKKAEQGQRDMTNMESNMNAISTSVSEMNVVVQSVDEAAQKINSIVEMINSISSQTNLLSLNASIEAARAGDAGRGFAVVATEIGSLANDSANATTEISKIIDDITVQVRSLSERSEASVRDIASSSDAVKTTGETFAQIFEALDQAEVTVNGMVEKMDKVNEIAMSVAAIAEEQSASTEEVTATVDTAATSAHDVAAESRNVDASAVTVSESAIKIGEFVDTFKI